MLKASIEKISLVFKRPAGTSRGTLTTKNAWLIQIWQENRPDIRGVGEASIIESLSPDWSDNYVAKLEEVILNIEHYQNTLHQELVDYPSIRFAIETALLDLKNGGQQILFPSLFTQGKAGIRINGLIWMGDHTFMLEQIKEKLSKGFTCIKLKIGAINFLQEVDLLRRIRQEHPASELELRVDANGAFSPDEAMEKLMHLSKYQIHSIEQPIKPNQWAQMAALCEKTPIPIALDEELIGINKIDRKRELLKTIQPHYIILKPSLVGGLQASDEWIRLAEEQNIGWWITSALECNVGLNAIAQYTFTKKSPMPQGLGTGQLFENNIASTLKIVGEQLFHH